MKSMINPAGATRTSRSHPLLIAEVQPSQADGLIGVTFCPGKKQNSSLTGGWERDLASDLDRIGAWGACAVVSLVEEHELAALQVAELGEEVRRRHLVWYHLPIRDVSVPDQMFDQAWVAAGEELRSRLRNGFRILVHCKGGLGRAGTIAAKLLVELGTDPAEAISLVRTARPGAIETVEQEQYVLAQTPAAKSCPDRRAPAIADRALGVLVGLAVGDAIGTTLEFSARDTRPLLTDMVGGGPFSLEAGQWTDDTAMALALADSLDACGGLDEADLMRRFADWRQNGAYSCTGECFDIGVTTSRAISRWQRTGDPIAGSSDPSTAGNGSLMRLAPVALRFWRDRETLRSAAERQSRTTHAAPAAVAACSAYAELLADVISGECLEETLAGLARRADTIVDPDLQRVAEGSWRGRPRGEIRSSGYVVHSFEAAIWSVARSGSFEEAVLTAANLGDDADTTAAIAGQLAGAVFGLSQIPSEWLTRLAWHDRIMSAGQRLIEAA